jgi:hypothetical protein
MTLSLDGDIGTRQAGRSGEVNPILGPRPPGSSCPTMVTTTCRPHQFDQSNRLLPWLTPSCAMAGAPSTRNGRPSGSTRLSRRMWPSTAHLRPVLSVTIGAITTVVFSPCATSRIRSCDGSQCAELDAEADGGVDVGTLVRFDVGFDVGLCTRDVHDVLRLLKASKVAATANGFMLMGQSLDQFGRRNKCTPCLTSRTTTLVPAMDGGTTPADTLRV